jgi:hypothetical protein
MPEIQDMGDHTFICFGKSFRGMVCPLEFPGFAGHLSELFVRETGNHFSVASRAP